MLTAWRGRGSRPTPSWRSCGCSGSRARAPCAKCTTRCPTGRSVAYTTTLKTLQVMTEQGLTIREDHRGQHLYRPRHAEQETLGRLVTDLLDRAFGGSRRSWSIHALNSRRASPRSCVKSGDCWPPRAAAREEGQGSMTETLAASRLVRAIALRPGRVRLAGGRDRSGHGALLLFLLRRRRAPLRYIVACLGLAAMTLAPARHDGRLPARGAESGASSRATVGMAAPDDAGDSGPSDPEAMPPRF